MLLHQIDWHKDVGVHVPWPAVSVTQFALRGIDPVVNIFEGVLPGI